MIISKVISGLGNQLFQYALARQIAIKNNDDLKLDISFYESQNLRNYTLNYYNIKAAIATRTDVEKVIGLYEQTSPYARLHCTAERYLPKQYKRFYKEAQWWGYEPNVFKIKGDVFLEGYWQHYKYFQNIQPQIFDELNLTNAVGINDYAIYRQVKQDERSVSLHIRRGDYLTDTDANKLMGILPLQYYRDAIGYISERLADPQFYIFSDDLDWARDNLTIDAPVNFVDIDNGKKDYIELAVMSACRHNILANSSFSWWGAFLNQNRDKIVISPRDWIKQPEINNRTYLQLPGWVKM
ncbi:alpha-1,2-fucosyltransferase [Mucilaginibacter glaciei]|uniref:Alpha-1,2-fucosyltransferase n=1 Tax=Mucilaginibacter glaciei TaxID=2772109 RepID=A0A926S614_9SPHI|nr:alpha-1,2-fucosyltransferase [Mucilaginibacter glaciei]MBD1393296.1 alpha-1,2-fucosyltransferase [Mucilaginibacter glaciei]